MSTTTNIDFKSRRDWLLSQLPEHSVAVLVGNTEKVRNKNITYPFRQDHDFYYMTGYAEPDAVAVLRPNHSQPFVLFNLARDPAAETNFGARTGQDGAKQQYQADVAYDIAELEQHLPGLLAPYQNVFWSDELGRFNHRVFDWLKQQRVQAKFDELKSFKNLMSVLPIMHQRRIVKEDSEIELLRQAINASVAGHKTVMQSCKPGINEQALTGAFFGKVSEFGCQDVGYPTIMASGNNACCLHYTENNDATEDGQIVLIDAGGDYQYYTADISRSFPVNGKFNQAQKNIYNLVLSALDNAIAKVKPGTAWNVMHLTAMETLCQGLIDLGIIKASFEQAMEQELYKKYSVHKTGHWLGLDVHDVGPYHHNGEWITLQPNMVFTIEPGLYFPANCDSVAEEYRGMGIRIEDDILVTASGHENLSEAAPRTITEIEAVMAE